ncbi:MAG: hypothetical protein ACREQ5_07870 [Candidatus Dormibacteria bacterium]
MSRWHPERAQLLRQYATWDVLPRLRARAENKPITPASRKFAGGQITQATVFLDWLAARHRTLRGIVRLVGLEVL